MIQKTKDEVWTNESGQQVPLKYISPGTRLRERSAASILKEAQFINKRLVAFKMHVSDLCQDVFILAMQEYKVKENHKGNFTWYNFDRSIKIEVNVNERIEFDDLLISACKAKLDEFLSDNLDSDTEFVKELVMDAFSTSKGKLDSNKVLSLNRYRTKIENPLFQEALDLLGDSIRRPDSKTYFRVSTLEADNSYTLIDLNFSSI